MLITKAARRYASAFLQIARENGDVESILADIQFIGNTIGESGELDLFLKR